MKIRSGFVSNSSSSSFVILGNEIGFSEIDLDKNTVWVHGGYLCEGANLFELKSGMLKLLKATERGIPDDTMFYNVYKTFRGDGGEVDKKDLPDSFGVYSFERDQHSSFNELLEKVNEALEVTYEGEEGVC